MKKIILTLIQIILLGIMAFSAYRLGDYYLQRHKANRAYGDIRDSVIELRSESEEAKGPEIKVEKKPKPRDRAKEVMAYLKGINEDVVGFIEVHGTSIAYPIAQAKDNDYYLWRGLDDETNIQGTIFMDYRSNPDLEDKNTVIYGHLMQRGDMFNPLKNFMTRPIPAKLPRPWNLLQTKALYQPGFFPLWKSKPKTTTKFFSQTGKIGQTTWTKSGQNPIQTLPIGENLRTMIGLFPSQPVLKTMMRPIGP